MIENAETGLCFSLDELKLLFSSLKKYEDELTSGAESVLIKIERFLYEYVTIQEIESLSQPE